ncbi:hypothetical protein CROQUDRAFT_95090 [Cronartium quercuum f. sp. fusiforme G11]|uniref:Uncharacterized protein n=1 Tax=Cronartium quercuum f. sp. fusiforme G11 TaxID=708437 RepID=A0A9P6NCW3_9BASI|nr:hypothetical protein CROQUDRAFT_95090 [Cronartium quercuum f. sp. fusiforme G11]
MVQIRSIVWAFVACASVHTSTVLSNRHKVLRARSTLSSGAPTTPQQTCICPSPPAPKPPLPTSNLPFLPPLPKVASFWQQPLPKPIGNLKTIQGGYDKLLPELDTYRDAVDCPEATLSSAVDSLSKLQKCFSEVVHSFGPACGCSIKPGSKKLFAFQRTFIQLFYGLQKIILVLQDRWPKTYLDSASDVLQKLSDSLQVLISLGLDLNIDVNAIFDGLDLHVFKDAKIDPVGLVLLSRKINGKIHRGEAL